MKITIVSRSTDTGIADSLENLLSSDQSPWNCFVEDVFRINCNEGFENILSSRQYQVADVVIVHPTYPSHIINNIDKLIILYSGDKYYFNYANFMNDLILRLPSAVALDTIPSIIKVLDSFGYPMETFNQHRVSELFKDAVFTVLGSLEMKDTDLPISSAPEPMSTPGLGETSTKTKSHHSDANRWGSQVLLRLLIEDGAISESIGSKLEEKLDLGSRYESELSKLECPILKTNASGKGLWSDARVLLVDDQHERGWSTLLAILIHGSTEHLVRASTFREYTEKYDNGPLLFAVSLNNGSKINVDEEIENVKDTYLSSQTLLPFDFAFIDYRLKDLEEDASNPDEVSGSKLIRVLHSIDESMPIIAISASDKRRTIESMKWIDCYYEKPSPTPEPEINDVQRNDYRRMVSKIAELSIDGRLKRGIYNIYKESTRNKLFNRRFKKLEIFSKKYTQIIHDIAMSKEPLHLCNTAFESNLKDLVEIYYDIYSINKKRYSFSEMAKPLFYHLKDIRNVIIHDNESKTLKNTISNEYLLILLILEINSLLYNNIAILKSFTEKAFLVNNDNNLTSFEDTVFRGYLAARINEIRIGDLVSSDRTITKNVTVLDDFRQSMRNNGSNLGINGSIHEEFGSLKDSSEVIHYINTHINADDKLKLWILSSFNPTVASNQTSVVVFCARQIVLLHKLASSAEYSGIKKILEPIIIEYVRTVAQL